MLSPKGDSLSGLVFAAAMLAAPCLLACGDGPSEDAVAGSASLMRASSHDARICSWNVRRLGHNFDGLPKDIGTARTIIDSNCDVVAVEEVMQVAGGGTPGYDALLAALGHDWSGVVTQKARPDTTSPNSEHYAFFFRRTAASLCDGWTAGAQFIKDDEDAFLREPAWTCLKVGARRRDLLLVAYHALYGSLAERRREVALIEADLDNDGRPDDVVRSIHRSRADADVVLVGDFNLTPGQLHDSLGRYKDLTLGEGSTINASNEITTNLFDHVVVAPDEPIAAEIGMAEVLDVRSATHGDYFETVSDHLPIRFTLPTPVVTGGGGGAEADAGGGNAEDAGNAGNAGNASDAGAGNAGDANSGNTGNADDSAPCQPGQVKGNRNSMIYHAPGDGSYAHTKVNVECFETAEQAEAAGYRHALN